MRFEIGKLAYQNKQKELEAWLKDPLNEIDSIYSDSAYWLSPGVVRVSGQAALWGLWGVMVWAVVRMILPARMQGITYLATGALVVGYEGRRYVDQHIFENNPAPAVNRHGWTLLHFAAEGNAIEVGTFLISMGANTKIRGNGKTFLQVADDYGHHSFIIACQAKMDERKIKEELITLKKEHIELLEWVDDFTNSNVSAENPSDVGPLRPATKTSESLVGFFKKVEGQFAYGLQGNISNDYVPNACFYEILANQSQVVIEHDSKNPVGSAEIQVASDTLIRPIVILIAGEAKPARENFFGQDLFFNEGKEPIFIGKIKDAHFIALTPGTAGLEKILDDFRKDFLPTLRSRY